MRLLALAALALCARGAPLSRIDRIFADCQQPGSPGAGVIVIHHGRVIYRNAFGLADLERNVPARPETNFRLASLTKQFTAMCVMMLAERGRLRCDQRLREFFPELPAWADSITVRQLLNHTSGIPDYEDAAPRGSLDQVTPATQLQDRDVLRILCAMERPRFEAGSRYAYSNSGYVMLGLIVEKLSGLTFPRFLERNIFRPLKMNRTVAHQEGISVVRNRAYGYVREQGRWVRRDQSYTSATLGDGGLYSSVDDLVKWDAALHRFRLVKPETWREAVAPGRLNDGRATRYGFGWEIAEQFNSPAWQHSGSTMGFRTHILRLPERELTVIVLHNRTDLDAGASARKIAGLVVEGH